MVKESGYGQRRMELFMLDHIIRVLQDGVALWGLHIGPDQSITSDSAAYFSNRHLGSPPLLL